MTLLSVQPVEAPVFRALQDIQYPGADDVLANVFFTAIRSQLQAERILKGIVSVYRTPTFFLHPYFYTGQIILQRAYPDVNGEIQMMKPVFATPVQKQWANTPYIEVEGVNIMLWLETKCRAFAPLNPHAYKFWSQFFPKEYNYV